MRNPRNGEPESWRQLRNRFLKKETEVKIYAAQEQALRTNSIKYAIDRVTDILVCKLCMKATESR